MALKKKGRKCVCVCETRCTVPCRHNTTVITRQHWEFQPLENGAGTILCLDLRPHQCMECPDHQSFPFESWSSASSWSERCRHHWARSTWIGQRLSCAVVGPPHCLSNWSCFWLSVPGQAVSEGIQVSASATFASSLLVAEKQKRLHLLEIHRLGILVQSPEEGDGTLPLYWPSESRLSPSSRLSELIDDDESRLSSEFSCSRSGNLQAKSTLRRTRCHFLSSVLYITVHYQTEKFVAKTKTETFQPYFSCFMDLILSIRVLSVSSECICAGLSSSGGFSTIWKNDSVEVH